MIGQIAGGFLIFVCGVIAGCIVMRDILDSISPVSEPPPNSEPRNYGLSPEGLAKLLMAGHLSALTRPDFYFAGQCVDAVRRRDFQDLPTGLTSTAFIPRDEYDDYRASEATHSASDDVPPNETMNIMERASLA